MGAVQCQTADGVAELTLDNPEKLNSMTFEMIRSLAAHLESLEEDDSVRAVILTGKGDRAFCSGANIDDWSPLDTRRFARIWVREGNRVFNRLAGFAKPTIAAMNGFALGGGLELSAACDMRVAAPNAFLALPETGLGVAPCWSGTQRLSRLLPISVVREMALFGRRVTAERACQLGYIAEISDDPVNAARQIAQSVKSKSPTATETVKYMLSAAANEDCAGSIDALAGGMLADSSDKREGVEAFKEKRAPKFDTVR